MPNQLDPDLLLLAQITGVVVGIANVWVWSLVAKRSTWWKNFTQKCARGVQRSMQTEFKDLPKGSTFTQYRNYGRDWMRASMSDGWSANWSRNLTFVEFKQALVNANAPAIPNIQASRNLDMFIEGAWAEYTRRVDRR